MIALISLLAFALHFLPLVNRKYMLQAKLFLLSYILGFLSFVMLPSYYPYFFGKQMLDLGFAADVPPEGSVMSQLYMLIGLYIAGSFIGYGMGYLLKPRLSIKVNNSYTVSGRSKKTVNVLLVLVVTVKIITLLIDARYGLQATGQRGSIFSPLLHMVINSALAVFVAIKLGFMEDKSSSLKLILMYAAILLYEAVVVDGSRRNFVYYVIFFVLPYSYFMKWIGLKQIIFGTSVMVVFVVAFGILRGYMGSGDVSAGWSALSDVIQSPQASLNLLLINSDFPMIYDALLGILLRVPSQVDYLYGSTLFKFLYFFVPRSIWPDKPESISVVVSALIYGRGDSDTVSFNPSLIGELFFNFGNLGVFFGALIMGFLLHTGMDRINRLSKSSWKGDIYYLGVFYIAALNIWRGYTFETIFTLSSSWILYYYLSRKFIQRYTTALPCCS